MTSHLLSLGHRRIAFIAGPERNADAAERRRGFRDGLGPAAKGSEVAGEFTEESGYAAMQQIVRANPRPTAVFAANDSMAIGALHALRDAQLSVPHDIAVAGFDDIPIARFLSPPLTTVRVDIAELGKRAVEELLKTLDGTAERRRKEQVIATELVVRESCGAALAAEKKTLITRKTQ